MLSGLNKRIIAALALAGSLGLMAGTEASAQAFAVQAKPTLCIDVAAGKAAVGTPIILWTCHGKAPQKFTLDPAGGRVRYAANPAYCVEQDPGGGRRLQLIECAYTWNRWRFDPGTGRFIGNTGECWDVPSGRYNPRQAMQVWKCHNLAPQRFVRH